jgi:hypothetical protein
MLAVNIERLSNESFELLAVLFADRDFEVYR